jgi:hypothetical protein
MSYEILDMRYIESLKPKAESKKQLMEVKGSLFTTHYSPLNQ